MTRKRNLILFASAVFLLWFSQYVFYPTLPEYLREKVDSLTVVGAVLAMYGLWQVVVRLPLGILIDAVGRQKLFLLGGFLLCAIGALLLGTGKTAGAMYLGRSLSGLAMSIWVPLVVVFSGFFPAAQSVRASAILSLVTAVARISATALNGYLNEMGGYVLAFLIAVAAAGLGVVLVLPVPVDSRAAGRPQLRPLLRLFLHRSVILPSLLAAINQYVIFGISLGFMPVLAKQLGAGDVALGYLATTNLLFFLLGNLIATSSSSRFTPALTLLASYSLFATAIATAAVSKGVFLLFVVQGCIGFAHGIGYPVLMGMTIRDIPSGQRTAAMGLHQSVYAAGIFVGPWASGALADAIGIRPMFGLTAALVLVFGLSGGILLSRRATLKDFRKEQSPGKPPEKGTTP
ncbi:MAG: MFS transporter [Spirochaetaceae bacterium]|nr:MAG: MFS transporter [Spirochaetaceae bacterium]